MTAPHDRPTRARRRNGGHARTRDRDRVRAAAAASDSAQEESRQCDWSSAVTSWNGLRGSVAAAERERRAARGPERHRQDHAGQAVSEHARRRGATVLTASGSRIERDERRVDLRDPPQVQRLAVTVERDVVVAEIERVPVVREPQQHVRGHRAGHQGRWRARSRDASIRGPRLRRRDRRPAAACRPRVHDLPPAPRRGLEANPERLGVGQRVPDRLLQCRDVERPRGCRGRWRRCRPSSRRRLLRDPDVGLRSLQRQADRMTSRCCCHPSRLSAIAARTPPSAVGSAPARRANIGSGRRRRNRGSA